MPRQLTFLSALLLSLLLLQCKKEEREASTQPVPPPEAITLIQGDNQVGGYNVELSDTIVIRIRPRDTSHLKRYSFASQADNQVGVLSGFTSEVVNGEMYVKALWRTGGQAIRQEIKFYLLGDCNDPSLCRRVDSVAITAVIKAPWAPVYTGGGTLEDIHFTSATEGLAVGSYNTGIMRTADGGNTWTSTPAFRSDLYQLHFLNSTTGFAVVTNNYAYFTNDGGKTFAFENWTPPVVGHLSSSDFHLVDRNTIYSVGRAGAIAKTTDGGRTWQKYTGFTFINFLRAITCLDENTCYACGDVAKVVKTTNGGADWQEQEVLLNNNLHALYFLDRDFGFAAGQYGALIRTTDGGRTWSSIKTGLRFSITAIRFFDRQHGLIVSTSGEIAETRDGGLTWKWVCRDNQGVHTLQKIAIKDAQTVYAVENGSIFKYDLTK